MTREAKILNVGNSPPEKVRPDSEDDSWLGMDVMAGVARKQSVFEGEVRRYVRDAGLYIERMACSLHDARMAGFAQFGYGFAENPGSSFRINMATETLVLGKTMRLCADRTRNNGPEQNNKSRYSYFFHSFRPESVLDISSAAAMRASYALRNCSLSSRSRASSSEPACPERASTLIRSLFSNSL